MQTKVTRPPELTDDQCLVVYRLVYLQGGIFLHFESHGQLRCCLLHRHLGFVVFLWLFVFFPTSSEWPECAVLPSCDTVSVLRLNTSAHLTRIRVSENKSNRMILEASDFFDNCIVKEVNFTQLKKCKTFYTTFNCVKSLLLLVCFFL